MKHLLTCFMLLFMHQSVIAHEFIEQLKERSSDFDNCEFTIELTSKILPKFDDIKDAREYAKQTILNRTTRSNIDKEKLNNMIDRNTDLYLNGHISYLKYNCYVKDQNNFSIFTFNVNNDLLHISVHFENGEVSFKPDSNRLNIMNKTDRKRWMTFLFEHEKIFDVFRDSNYIIRFKNDSNQSIIEKKINNSNFETALEYENKNLNTYFPLEYSTITQNNTLTAFFDRFTLQNDKIIPMLITKKQYEHHPFSNNLYQSFEMIYDITCIEFNEQNIDWLIPPDVTVHNEITNESYITDVPILASEIISLKKGG